MKGLDTQGRGTSAFFSIWEDLIYTQFSHLITHVICKFSHLIKHATCKWVQTDVIFSKCYMCNIYLYKWVQKKTTKRKCTCATSVHTALLVLINGYFKIDNLLVSYPRFIFNFYVSECLNGSNVNLHISQNLWMPKLGNYMFWGLLGYKKP